MVQTVLSLVSQFGVFFVGAYISIKTGSIAPSVILLFVQLMNYIISPLMQIPSSLSKRLSCKPLFKKIGEIIVMKNNKNKGKIIENIDEIIVMKNGNIVEHGSYKELMDNNSTFKSLVELG